MGSILAVRMVEHRIYDVSISQAASARKRQGHGVCVAAYDQESRVSDKTSKLYQKLSEPAATS